MRPQLAELPSLEELVEAVGKLKNSKAGGNSGILPEMVKVACKDPDIWTDCSVLSIQHGERSVPKDWTDAVLVPIPK